jgi:hypothetical protein
VRDGRSDTIAGAACVHRRIRQGIVELESETPDGGRISDVAARRGTAEIDGLGRRGRLPPSTDAGPVPSAFAWAAIEVRRKKVDQLRSRGALPETPLLLEIDLRNHMAGLVVGVQRHHRFRIESSEPQCAVRCGEGGTAVAGGATRKDPLCTNGLAGLTSSVSAALSPRR